MSNVVVVGTQWGDEGKGKIVDWLSERADLVVRFQGGHNAGHTLVVEGKTYKLSLLPSGIIRGKTSVIGTGVVIDPWALLAEIETLRGQGITITTELLHIADNATLILPLHAELDRAREAAARGEERIGTTGRGIGPAYEDKIGRRALRLCDLEDLDHLEQRLSPLLQHHNALRIGLGTKPVDADKLITDLTAVAPQILPYAKPIWQILQRVVRSEKHILFEGAQGAMLDIDHGTYPYVTSSTTLAGHAAAGSGVGVKTIDYVLGITKAYATRVGSGPFPTELHDEMGQILGERGKEFGTVTGRKRRCGWFDAIFVRQMIHISGVNGIALTKLDVLDGLDEIKICVGYEINGKTYHRLPPAAHLQACARPIYKVVEGWKESTCGIRNLTELPFQAVAYIHMIEELIGACVALVSTSPEREDTILVRNPFASI